MFSYLKARFRESDTWGALVQAQMPLLGALAIPGIKANVPVLIVLGTYEFCALVRALLRSGPTIINAATRQDAVAAAKEASPPVIVTAGK